MGGFSMFQTIAGHNARRNVHRFAFRLDEKPGEAEIRLKERRSIGSWNLFSLHCRFERGGG